MSSGSPAPLPRLTAREIAILDLVARGLDDKTVAAHLALSHGTVRNRLTRLYRKLGVSGRTAAALRWHTRGVAAPVEAVGRRPPQK